MTIDEEFQKLIPPLTDDEYRQLEENCIKEGIREAILVWDRGDDLVIVDGHNRYKIAREHNLKWSHKVMHFESREEVKAWIRRNQLGRRNVDLLTKGELLEDIEKYEAQKAKKRQATSTGGTTPQLVENLPQAGNGKVRDKMGAMIGVSGRQYDRIKKINHEATPQVKQAVRDGKLSINQAYNSTFPKVLDPVREAKERHEAFQEKAKEDVVDFKDAMLDKYDQNIISHGFVRDLYRMGTAVKLFGLSHKKEEIEEQIAKLSEETIKNIIINIQASIDELERTKKLLERRGK